ncbi:MAG: FG-GAP-like repeat-containing protein [Nocardioides sp.]
MQSGKSRFVSACQQVLALGAVLAVLAPATSVVSLDVVGRQPSADQPVDDLADHDGRRPAGPAPVPQARMAIRVSESSEVETDTVSANVSEIQLTEATPQPRTEPNSEPEPRVGQTQPSEVLSAPQRVAGYGAVGITWSPETKVAESGLTVQARTQTKDTWSAWTALEYHDEHGPDPASAEAKNARPGTEALLVGNVDEVQVRVRTEQPDQAVPSDMKLAVITPGESAATIREAPAINTAQPDSAAVTDEPASGVEEGDGADKIALQAATGAAPVTSKPTIYSRAQWGADESRRDASSLRYYEVHAGFVHHTVNANNYTRSEVPGIIRSIYAYHTGSRGWSDIGYNFLIDRFGRIWEGRYGGVDRPVVGAHTLHRNDYAFAAAAIGNFESTAPSTAMVSAYGSLFAWKLSLHGVDPNAPSQPVGSRRFPAVSGHRDAALTACPGRYLYAKIPTIRALAAARQAGWSGRELDGDLASTAHPDLVVRRASDNKAYVIPTGGLTRFHWPAVSSAIGWRAKTVVASPDLTGDDLADLVARDSAGLTRVHPGVGRGRFGAGLRASAAFARVKLITAAGDLNQDSHNDLVALRVSDNRLVAYLGTGRGAFRARILRQVMPYNLLAGSGDVTGDGRPDLVGRDSAGRLFIHRGGRLGRRIALPGRYPKIDSLAGLGDYTGDGRADLVMRGASGAGYLLPSRGDGTFGHPVGPLKGLAGLSGITGGGQITGHPAPDLVARSGDKLVVVRGRGTFNTGRPIATGLNLAAADKLLNVGDWDRDGYGDIVTRDGASGRLELRRGNGQARFATPITLGEGFDSVSLLAAVGDMTGDGYPDLMGQPAGRGMRIFPGRGRDGLGVSYAAWGAIDASRQFGVGRWDRDGAPDTLVVAGDTLRVYVGNGPGGLSGYRALPITMRRFDWVGGIRNLTGPGHPAIIVRNRRTGDLWAMKANATRFGRPRFLAEGFDAYDLIG